MIVVAIEYDAVAFGQAVLLAAKGRKRIPQACSWSLADARRRNLSTAHGLDGAAVEASTGEYKWRAVATWQHAEASSGWTTLSEAT
jgi:hypothetical protein